MVYFKRDISEIIKQTVMFCVPWLFLSVSDSLTCFHVFELLLKLLWSEAVMVKPIIPFDSLQYLQIATYQPVTPFHNHLHK